LTVLPEISNLSDARTTVAEQYIMATSKENNNKSHRYDSTIKNKFKNKG